MLVRRVSVTNLNASHEVGPTGSNQAQIYAKDGKLFAQLQGYGAVELADLVGQNAGSPVGTVISYGGASLPAGWLECNGDEVAAQYTDLNTLLNGLYGTGGNGRSLLPDLRGRMPLGMGTGSGLTARSQGNTGGAESVTLDASMIPSHNHTATDSGHSHGVNDSGHSHDVSDNGHSHSIDDWGHTHDLNDNGHSHQISDTGHSHGTDDYGHTHSMNSHSHNIDGNHNHSGLVEYSFNSSYINEGQGSSTSVLTGYSEDSWGNYTDNTDFGDADSATSTMQSQTTGISINNAYTNISMQSEETGISMDSATTGISIDNSNSGVSVDSANSNISINNGSSNISVGSTGGGSGHDNMSPWLALKFLIKT